VGWEREREHSAFNLRALKMPESGYEFVRQSDLESEVGYDFCSARFGPPPGVGRGEKERLDNMGDEQFFGCFLQWGVEKQQSLMVSEKQRR